MKLILRNDIAKKRKENRMNQDKLLQEVASFQDIVTDFRDCWGDLNNILDYEIQNEKEILDDFQSLINHFEEEIKLLWTKINIRSFNELQ